MPEVTQSDIPARQTGTARDLEEGGLIAVTWAGFALATTFVAIRVYARKHEARRLFFDDYWILFGWILLLANAICQTVQAQYVFYLVDLAAGRYEFGPESKPKGVKYAQLEFVIINFFWTVLWCVKASFLALYYRLFKGLPKYQVSWWAVSVFTFLAYVGCWMTAVWTCHPPPAFSKFGHCNKPVDVRGGQISIGYSTAVDVATDFLIMLLPLRLLYSLQIDRRQKMGLALVFALGLIVVAIALVRMTQILGRERSDPVGLAVWGVVESSVSVVVGSLPPLRTFLHVHLQKFSRRGQPPSSRSSGTGLGETMYPSFRHSKGALQEDVCSILPTPSPVDIESKIPPDVYFNPSLHGRAMLRKDMADVREGPRRSSTSASASSSRTNRQIGPEATAVQKSSSPSPHEVIVIDTPRVTGTTSSDRFSSPVSPDSSLSACRTSTTRVSRDTVSNGMATKLYDDDEEEEEEDEEVIVPTPSTSPSSRSRELPITATMALDGGRPSRTPRASNPPR